MTRRLPRLFKNKYIIATLAFAVWIIFFDRNDLITQIRYRVQLHGLRVQKAYLEQEISRADKDLQALRSSPAKLEKFAREQYLMKREGEDVFVIAEGDSAGAEE